MIEFTNGSILCFNPRDKRDESYADPYLTRGNYRTEIMYDGDLEEDTDSDSDTDADN